MDHEEEFSTFVRLCAADLQRAAWLLTGDWSSAQDLVQTSLAKTWLRWSSIRRRDAQPAYVRRVMMTTFLAWRRRRWSCEVAVDQVPEPGAIEDLAGEVSQRAAVSEALRRLPKQQRAAVVLRYFADLTEQDTAYAMRCSVGTVKSHTARALANLRANGALQAAMVDGSRR